MKGSSVIESNDPHPDLSSSRFERQDPSPGDEDNTPSVLNDNPHNLLVKVNSPPPESNPNPLASSRPNSCQKPKEFDPLNIFSAFLIPHSIAIGLTYLLFLLQTFGISTDGFRSELCGADSNIYLKLYSTLKENVLFWELWFLVTCFSLFFGKEFLKVRRLIYPLNLMQILFVFISNMVLNLTTTPFAYLFKEIVLFSIGLILFLIGNMIGGNAFFGTFRKFLRTTGYLILILIHSTLVQYLESIFKPFFEKNFSSYPSKNFYQVFIAIYSSAFTALVKRLLFIHHKAVLEESPNNVISLLMPLRICLIYLLSSNMSNILMMKTNNWGGWILIYNYSSFLVNSYLQFSASRFLLKKSLEKIADFKFFNKVLGRFKEQTKSDVECNFNKCFAGCMLEMQFICMIRLANLRLLGRWLSYGHDAYYSNCNLEISEKFFINWDAFYVVLAINLLSVLIFARILKIKKFSLFRFLTLKNVWFNAYLLCTIHNSIENTLQIVRVATWTDNS